MEKIFLDMTNEEKISVVKENVRQTLVNEFMEFLNEKFDRARKLSSNEIGVIVGQAKDQDGWATDVVAKIKISCMSWYDKTDCVRPVRKFDLDLGTAPDYDDGADAYEKELEAKKNKAPKK